MVLFQNCIRRPRLPTKMAAMVKNRKFRKKKIFKKSSPLKLVGQLGPNFGGKFLG